MTVTLPWLAETTRLWSTAPESAVATLERRLAGVEVGGAVPVPVAELARASARLGQLRIFLGRLEVAADGLRRALARHEDGYLQLQLASASFWIGGTVVHHEAAALVEAAFVDARVRRDGPLAIASLCLRGDLALAAGNGGAAVEAFGEALGLSEFATSEVASVAPLAGLARAHAAWRAPGKAAPLARRARDRAERTGDRAGLARALLALGTALGEPDTLLSAAQSAEDAPHRPLALLARFEAARFGTGDLDALNRAAAALGMRLRPAGPDLW